MWSKSKGCTPFHMSTAIITGITIIRTYQRRMMNNPHPIRVRAQTTHIAFTTMPGSFSENPVSYKTFWFGVRLSFLTTLISVRLIHRSLGPTNLHRILRRHYRRTRAALLLPPSLSSSSFLNRN